MKKNRHFKTPESTRKANERWRKNNPDKMAEYQIKWARKNLKSRLLTVAKSRAKKRGVYFDLSKDDFDIPSHCPILGIELVSGIGQSGRRGGNPNSPSLDRIDPSLGYVRGNVQVVSHLANSMKGAATPDQLLKFAEWVTRTYEEE